MSSRKRNKGRARKTKAKAASVDRLSEHHPDVITWNIRQLFTRKQENVARCDHGCKTLPEDHIGHKFLDTFAAFWDNANPDSKSGVVIDDAMKETRRKHPEVWNDGEKLETMRDTFLCHGTDLLLDHSAEGERIKYAGLIATVAIMLEQYVPTKGYTGPESSTDYLRIADVLEGDERSILQFYSKRINCHCLEEMRTVAKALPKTGLCHCCRQRKQRKQLMVCSRCKVLQYCSKECQEAHWLEHKLTCV